MPIGMTNEFKGLHRTIHLDAEMHLPKIAFFYDHSAKWHIEKFFKKEAVYEAAESFWQANALGNAKHSILIKKLLGAGRHL